MLLNRRSVLFCVSALAVASGSALASTPAYGFEGGVARVATTGAIDRTLGWDFTVGGTDLIVEALGYFDAGNTTPTGPADGLFLSHDVAIFDAQGQVVVQGTVGAGPSGFTVSNWRYTDVEETVLAAGATYTVSGFAPTGTYNTADPYDPLPSLTSDWIFSLNPPDVRRPELFIDGAIAFELSRFALNGSGLEFPLSTSSSEFGLAGANFLFREVPSPACPGNVNGDGAVDLADLLAVLAAFGTAAPPGSALDLDGSGVVDLGDVLAVLAAFGTTC